MMEPKVLILGAGTFGTSTAYHLSQSYQSPSRITIIDQFASPPSPTAPAAIDINRIIRTDYPTPLYCNLAFEAIHAWFWSLELAHHFHKSGYLFLDETDSSLAAQILQVFHDRGSTQTEEIPLDTLAARWPFLAGTATTGFQRAYHNPEAGWCDAAAATASLMAATQARGVQRVTGRVAELLLDRERRGVVGVRLADGQVLHADKIVLATGAWTSSLLSPVEDALGIAEPDRIERQLRATGRLSAYYTLAEEEEEAAAAGVPVVVYGRQGEVVPPSAERRVLKYNDSATAIVNTVATASGRKISVPPAGRSQFDVPERLKVEMEEAVAVRLPSAFERARRPDFWRLCWDAQTPTEDWLLCKHPHPPLGNLFLAVGGSFHAYKFLPNVGKYMVNVLNGKSNGEEKDRAWAWKGGEEWRAARERMGREGRELRDFDAGDELAGSSQSQAKL